MKTPKLATLALLLAPLTACSDPPEGLALAPAAETTVKMDFFAKPLPDIALPNDIATRHDPTSPTGRRVNASMVTPTAFESRTRELLDRLDGWGVMQPISIPFSGPIDPMSIRDRHDDDDYASDDDAIYVINIDTKSSSYGALVHLDLGNGNYPVVLERRDRYWKNDPRGTSMSLLWEEADEDTNRNGVLDLGEDTDADGILDVPNYLPGTDPAPDDLAARTDALMTFYERSSHTVVARPLVPMEDRTRYAVVVTRRVLDTSGKPVGSPFEWINHTAQTDDLRPLLDVLPAGLAVSDIAFTYSFTTQTIRADWQAIRDGLYGTGAQSALATEFPAELTRVAQMRDEGKFPGMKNPHLLYGEVWREAHATLLDELLDGQPGMERDFTLSGTEYVDFFTSGTFVSPQLMPRRDAEDELLPLHDQVWPSDISVVPAKGYPEDVYYTLSVPRKEVSVRGQGKPAPVVLLGHGYTSNRFEVMQFAGYLARHGLAVIAIDGPSHGIGISEFERVAAISILGGLGVGRGADALLTDRAFDQNFDGTKDTGVDFWTSYLFHTRDMVRQYALDYMQLVRIVKSFDGKRRWAHDLNGDGEPELAGDFDADGVVDVGADSPMYAFGGSLGGIMSMVLGAVEPSVDAIAPISGGGGYGDMGPRSTQGGVFQAFILRAMGPLFVGTIAPETGEMTIETIVVDGNDDVTFPIGRVAGVQPNDTMLVENLTNGTRRCGFVAGDGTVRASNETDVGHMIRISFYKGWQVVPSEDCILRDGATPFHVLDTFMEDINFRGEFYPAGSPLVALMEGLGMRRGHPDFRKLAGFGQLVLDPADPAPLARNLLRDPLHYANGETTGAHSLIITTMGDTAVPVSGGAAVGRAAGIIGYLEDDARYGKPQNQMLIDTYTLEGVHNINRYENSKGEGVHLDLENFAQGDDMYGTEVPRFDAPPHIGFDVTDPLGGKSAAIFPYNVPEGQHGFDMPGGMTDRARKQCAEACTEMGTPDPCGCGALHTFDIGLFMMNMIGSYFASGGTVLSADLCMTRNDCAGTQAAPPIRDVAILP